MFQRELLPSSSDYKNKQPWKWRQQVSPKHRHQHTRLKGIRSQKVLILMLTAFTVSDFMTVSKFLHNFSKFVLQYMVSFLKSNYYKSLKSQETYLV